ncbi:MAG: CoA-binding protein [Ferruginibacter sp.]|nr:CoA-binding protein [Cytophagales bacterium]
MKKTLILGATDNPDRFAYRAAHSLLRHGHDIALVGIRKGEVAGHPILNGKAPLAGVDTVTLYVGPRNQPEWYDYILGLAPRRIVFNPGTENPELARLARSKGIETLEACTLVMLSANTY